MSFAPFVLRHHLFDADTGRIARDLVARVSTDTLTTVRFMWADQHGILRGKTYTAAQFESALYGGVGISSTMLLKDTSHKTIVPVLGHATLQNVAELVRFQANITPAGGTIHWNVEGPIIKDYHELLGNSIERELAMVKVKG